MQSARDEAGRGGHGRGRYSGSGQGPIQWVRAGADTVGQGRGRYSGLGQRPIQWVRAKARPSEPGKSPGYLATILLPDCNVLFATIQAGHLRILDPCLMDT